MLETILTIVGHASSGVGLWEFGRKLVYGEIVADKVEATDAKVDQVLAELKRLDQEWVRDFERLSDKIAYSSNDTVLQSQTPLPQVTPQAAMDILKPAQEALGRPLAATTLNATSLALDQELYRNPDEVFHDVELYQFADLSKWRSEGMIPIRFEHLRQQWIGWQKPFFIETHLGIKLDWQQKIWMPSKQPLVGSTAAVVHAPQKTAPAPSLAVPPRPKTGLQPSDTFRDHPDFPLMVVIPTGLFFMGDDKSKDSKEKPAHEVVIQHAFAMGVYQVTFDEWDACVRDGYCQANPQPDDRNWGRGKRPVINVSWDDINAPGKQGFIAWLNSKLDGSPYRLPSEAEWEYAARAGTTTDFWMGDSISKKDANYGHHIRTTVTVDSYAPNPFGLYQVHGNVWEWVQDCWNKDYSTGPGTQAARTTGGCNQRVLRGGSWDFYPYVLRSAFRGRIRSVNRNVSYGFRIAKTL